MLYVQNKIGCVNLSYVSRLIVYCTIILFANSFIFAQGDEQQSDYENFDPSNFDKSSINVDNPWFPLVPWTQLVYEGSTEEDGERIPHRVVFTVTNLTKVIGGVNTVVCWDQDYADGELEESELVFFAQDKNGTVWHFGQYPEEYDEGKLIEAPCWLHGFEDAVAGIIMKTDPQLGSPSYSQGWAPSVDWTDRAIVYKMGETTNVPAGTYEDVLIMDETSLSEPDAHQLKYYARGVGNVRVGWYGEGEISKETLELVDIFELIMGAREEVLTEVLGLERRAYENSEDIYGLTVPLVQRMEE